jgi:hypothetical protein
MKRGTLGFIVLMATLSAGLSNAFADGEKTDATATGTASGTGAGTATAKDTVMNHEAKEVWGVAFKYEF